MKLVIILLFTLLNMLTLQTYGELQETYSETEIWNKVISITKEKRLGGTFERINNMKVSV